MRTPIPQPNTPVLGDDEFSRVWYLWLAGLVGQPPPAAAAVLDPSPADMTAPAAGTFYISGGTVTLIEVTRGADTIDAGVIGGPIPVGLGDIVTITYAVAPIVTFMGV